MRLIHAKFFIAIFSCTSTQKVAGYPERTGYNGIFLLGCTEEMLRQSLKTFLFRQQHNIS